MDSLGCSKSDTVDVKIKNCLVYDRCKNVGYDADELLIPNVITPNSDHLNEFFVLPEYFKGSSLAVFDRWGVKVYSNDNYSNRWNGGDLSAGVYYYLIRNQCLSKDLKGSVSIVK